MRIDGQRIAKLDLFGLLGKEGAVKADRAAIAQAERALRRRIDMGTPNPVNG